jgi:hypothetical protein
MHLAKKFITSLTNFFDFFFKDSVRNNNTCQIWDLVKKKKTFADTKKEINGRERGERKPRRQEEEKCNKR